MTPTLDTLLSGSNATYIAELYGKYLENPGSVDATWAGFFTELEEDGRAVLDELRGATWAPSGTTVIGGPGGARPTAAGPGLASGPSTSDLKRATHDSIRALMMIRTYRVRGHLIANFDPLGLEGKSYHPELDYKYYGFNEEDLDRPIFIDFQLGRETATLKEILGVLKATYCDTIGVEFMHMQDPEEKAWIRQRIEDLPTRHNFTHLGKRTIFQRLIEAEGFERFLDKKWKGTKRFGLDGGESLIAALEQIVKRGSQLGVDDIVIGMPHRGRLNVLASVMCKPYRAIFAEFHGVASDAFSDVQGSGDVKYHLGVSADRVFDGTRVHLSLTANPSHLEAVNPVVVGKVRSKQNRRGDKKRQNVMGILMHGDAAFAGQGLVAETLEMSQLEGYTTGGTIHFIVNNQIGFTTVPSKSRSSPYCSDVAKSIQAPIFHVNGDDPEAVVHVARLAIEFRQEFKRDVVIDMFCYRRHGHNEGDEPMFTQPIMYRTIAKHQRTLEVYRDRLIREGVLTQQDAETMINEFEARLEADFETATTYRPNKADWLEGVWDGLIRLNEEEELREDDTSVPMELLKTVGNAISRKPDNFNLHPKIARQLDAKAKAVDQGKGIDWATAEALAFGTLMTEGTSVRLSGQDCGRGTFSHRHSVLIDQVSEEKYLPLQNICEGQGNYEVLDSPLSEFGVLGYEYGYSLDDPHTLVLWEAQFGDFANGAQVMIDQFISSGESKWMRFCGLVMLLPHGMEGQGPEHSSARLERYLQLCAEDNLQVCNITTPANYYHALRRQVRRNYRKPLVIMSPKSLLRHKQVISDLKDMAEGTKFRRVLPEVDKLAKNDKIRRVVLCSGKVYYDLLQTRRDEGLDDVAIVRVEQLYPWPRKGVMAQLARYPKAEVVWCQEEPANMGSWTFVLPRLAHILQSLGLSQTLPFYAGRCAAASPATGFAKVHAAEQAQLVNEALNIAPDDLPQPFRPPAKPSDRRC
ncbi:2-oxoglutarate dehydrogenase E1 component [Magnetospira sp. QH-2]|uniref:2-oxoglutarate dehydrogenase E1 component n=1 Tax=Magnetospira sp. (strain QH-2) TaxID=1288970 RepID=UPI0003E81320|nr:2-oxoglutarate dehydrogenase E1 component [Magnetospira sp. QH-2]CCQ75436.1 2-oxoglutarate dehydrogenase E1 component [Magnetospira sp. QH-2]